MVNGIIKGEFKSGDDFYFFDKEVMEFFLVIRKFLWNI